MAAVFFFFSPVHIFALRTPGGMGYFQRIPGLHPDRTAARLHLPSKSRA